MARSERSPHGQRVVVCGGGVAAVEALLALRSQFNVGLDLHLVAPNPRFIYQPLAVAAPFALADTDIVSLAEIAADQRATLHVDSLEHVDARERTVRLGSRAVLAYDALVVAVGARRHDWLEGALHFGGSASVDAFQRVLARLEDGSAQRLAFVNPPGTSWTLPLYELALLTASHLADRGVISAEITVVTPEDDPLGMFGPTATRILRDLLGDRGIVLRSGARAQEIRDGKLHLDPPATVEAELVVTLAQLEGPRMSGLRCDAGGFIPVDEHGRVRGLQDVYAAGDGTDSPIKQGGIAAQQADAAVAAIAAQMRFAVAPPPPPPTLRAMLLTGIAPTYLRAKLAGGNGESFETSASPLWWPPSKIAARYLTPYLADHNALTRDRTLESRSPSTRTDTEVRASNDEARALALVFADRDAAERHYHSALQWLEVIERLDGVLPPGYMSKRAEWRDRAAGERR